LPYCHKTAHSANIDNPARPQTTPPKKVDAADRRAGAVFSVVMPASILDHEWQRFPQAPNEAVFRVISLPRRCGAGAQAFDEAASAHGRADLPLLLNDRAIILGKH